MSNFMIQSLTAYKSIPGNKKLCFDAKKSIYKNKQWEVFGDASLWCQSHSYLIEGNRIMEGLRCPDDKEVLWPNHVCQKMWVDKDMFLEAYGIAYRHYKINEQFKQMSDEHARNQN
jgi:hypothetical protein